MEQQPQSQPQPRPTVASNPYSPMSNLQQFNGPPVQAFAAQRRDEINQQLLNMKNNLAQSNTQIKSQDVRELNAERMYARNPPANVKKRNDGITVDTSSEESSRKSISESSSESKQSSSSSSSSSSSTSTSSSSSDSNVKSKSQGSSKRNFIDKSLSSRNNQSTLSKRKYKKQLTFDTS